jgi:hypothetical protein
MTTFPSSPNCTLITPDSKQFTPHLRMLLEEIDSPAKMISSSAGIQSFLHSRSTYSCYAPLGLPPQPLVLTHTSAIITNARHCNPSPSSLILTLLDMHTPSKARIPQVLIIPRHQPFMSPLQSYLAKLLAQRKKLQQPAKFYSKTSSLPL